MATTRPSIWATAAPAAGSASSFARSPAEFACCAANWSRSRPETRGEKTMKPQLTKGNEAIVKAAVLAGCRAYYGYPITPASEIAEAAALYLPQVGGVFIQAESETASVNMLYGGAAAGVRVLSGSSGPGISLMQEGISYLPGGRRNALCDRRHHARRSRPGQHCAGAERLSGHFGDMLAITETMFGFGRE